MARRPPVEAPTQFGEAASEAGFWVEYPSGLVDLTRAHPLPSDETSYPPPAIDPSSELDIPCDHGRTVRIHRASSALVVVDMQNFFLHPDLRPGSKGLAYVPPLVASVPLLRSAGLPILWVNWGLTEHELRTIPPALARSFSRSSRGGFGSQLPADFGRLLMRGERNSDLYGPLQALYERGRDQGSDVWLHKNRISGLWGYQSALDLHLKEHGIRTLLFAGVNTDQCVAGTLFDAYYRGYDVLLLSDATATGSPEGGYENVLYNVGGSYGFVTDTKRIIDAIEQQPRTSADKQGEKTVPAADA